ncbi:MAG: hypothetical protein IT373_02215, partial [Polyangiaceae bacterium]|nr:hypothetical protein [Polyangiaceae bacterium]
MARRTEMWKLLGLGAVTLASVVAAQIAGGCGSTDETLSGTGGTGLTTSTGGVGGAGGNLFTTGGSSQGGTGGSVPSDCPVPCQPAE